MKFRESLFWDTDPKKLDPKKHARYIIERVLDFGNDDEVRWMSRQYNQRTIKNIVDSSRALHPETKNLWQIITSVK